MDCLAQVDMSQRLQALNKGSSEASQMQLHCVWPLPAICTHSAWLAASSKSSVLATLLLLNSVMELLIHAG